MQPLPMSVVNAMDEERSLKPHIDARVASPEQRARYVQATKTIREHREQDQLERVGSRYDAGPVVRTFTHITTMWLGAYRNRQIGGAGLAVASLAILTLMVIALLSIIA